MNKTFEQKRAEEAKLIEAIKTHPVCEAFSASTTYFHITFTSEIEGKPTFTRNRRCGNRKALKSALKHLERTMWLNSTDKNRVELRRKGLAEIDSKF